MGFAGVNNVLGRFVGRGRKQEKQHVCVEDAALVERDRMARELHDIVSHGLALILVRAGVARSLDDPGQTNEAIEVIERTARDSLAEMRHMLDLLRLPYDAGWAPQPDLGGVDELVAVARAAGHASTSSGPVRRTDCTRARSSPSTRSSRMDCPMWSEQRSSRWSSALTGWS
jgi:hypothetical protein